MAKNINLSIQPHIQSPEKSKHRTRNLPIKTA